MLPNILTLLRSVTLEPSMVLYFTALAMTSVNGQSLLLQKVCHPGLDAPPSSTTCQDEVHAQQWTTQIQTWKQIIVLFGPVFFILFAGPWSDNHGKRRKPLLYLPVCGQILSDLLCIVNVYFWSWSPVIAALSESILPSLTGGRACFLIGVNSYVSDITTETSRTVRLGVCAAIYFLGTPMGAFIYGLVVHTIGFYGVFLVCIVLNLVALVHLYLFVSENKCDGEICKLKTWEGLVDLRNIVQSFKTTIRPRKGWRRAIVLIIIGAAPLTMAPLQGEFTVLYFFLRYNFHWDESDYGFYAAYKFIIIFFGTLVTLGVFSRLLRISDAAIGVISCVTLIIASLGYTFSTAVWEMFLYSVVDFTHGAGLTVVYSILSKSVDHTEIGQVNSIVGVTDALFPLINLPLYSQVYNHTFVHMPGAFFLLSAVYGVTALIIFGVVYFLQRKQQSQESSQENSKL